VQGIGLRLSIYMERQNILNFTGSTKKLLLIYKEMQKQTLTQPVNIMLTPQFYTLKREQIPVQYAYQAKRIAPSLFEGLLDDTKHYSYFVTKEEDGWLFIAYEMEEIERFLEEKGILVENVGKVFFAEQAASSFVSPVKIGEKEALINVGESVVVVPQVVLDESVRVIQINDSFTPKKGIALEGTQSSFLTSTHTYALAVLFVLFGLMFFVEGSRYGGDSAAQEEEMQMLLEEHPSLQSSYTRDSIASKYKTIDTKERKKREVVKALSSMLFKGTTLTLLSMNDKKFQAEFTCTSENVAKKLQTLAKKEKFNSSKIANSHNVKIEGRL